MNNYYPQRTDWYPVESVGPNISHYIYNDVNRNGIYDIEDKPMMKIAVKMTRPDGSTVIRRSNLNGFVNFRHSLTEKNVEVREPGEYIFEVIVPDDWEVTSGNKIQKAIYSKAPKTRPGIIIDKVPEPVGLAPILNITGTVKVKRENNLIENATRSDVLITAITPTGDKQFFPIDDNGDFSFIGEQGIWKILFQSLETNDIYERTLCVEHYPIKISTVIIGERVDDVAKINHTIDFENITKSKIQKMPNGIASLNWTNLIVTHYQFYKGEGYVNGIISGEYVGYNTSGHPVTIERDEGFDFYGAFFSVAWLNRAEGETLEIRAWRGEKLVTDEEYTLSAIGPFWLDANYRNITKLVLSTKHYWQFVVDHIKVGV